MNNEQLTDFAEIHAHKLSPKHYDEHSFLRDTRFEDKGSVHYKKIFKSKI